MVYRSTSAKHFARAPTAKAPKQTDRNGFNRTGVASLAAAAAGKAPRVRGGLASHRNPFGAFCFECNSEDSGKRACCTCDERLEEYVICSEGSVASRSLITALALQINNRRLFIKC